MLDQEPAGAEGSSGARGNRRDNAPSKPPAKPRSPRATLNGGGTATGPSDEAEGFYPAEVNPSAEGFFPTRPGAPQQSPVASANPPRLASPRLGRPIHVNTARLIVALCSLAILMFVVVATFVTLWNGHIPIDYLMRVLEVFFAPLVALVGVAVAFYYYRGGGNAL
jgi:hypothetical protein